MLQVLHFQCFIPYWIETLLDGLGFPLLRLSTFWNELGLDIRVTQAIWIHWDQVAGLYHCNLHSLSNMKHLERNENVVEIKSAS